MAQTNVYHSNWLARRQNSDGCANARNGDATIKVRPGISFPFYGHIKKKRKAKIPISCRNENANTTGELNSNEQPRLGFAHFCRLVDFIFGCFSHACVCSAGGGRVLSMCYNHLLLDCWDYFSGSHIKENAK